MSGPARWSGSVTSATTAPTKAAVSSVEAQVLGCGCGGLWGWPERRHRPGIDSSGVSVRGRGRRHPRVSVWVPARVPPGAGKGKVGTVRGEVRV